MKIGLDLRSLQYKTSRGFAYYATPLIHEIGRQFGDENFVGLLSGRPAAPNFGIKTKQFFFPSKINNATLSFLKRPHLDAFLGVETVWFPNLCSWAFSEKAKVILTVHDLSFLVNPSWFSPRERLWHRTIDAVGLIRRADKILTLSQHTANELNDILKIPAEKISVVSPGVPPLVWSNKAVPPYPYILFIGVIEPRKNIETALAAFDLLAEKNKDIHFVLAGCHSTAYRLPPTAFSNRIHFLGPVSQEEKSSLLRGAQALFFPSFYEGFGFPALEAMAAGTPVVASSAGALPETIGNAGVLLDPNDTGAFALALAQVLGDNVLRQTLIVRGRERVKNFSWEKCARETMRTLNDL